MRMTAMRFQVGGGLPGGGYVAKWTAAEDVVDAPSAAAVKEAMRLWREQTRSAAIMSGAATVQDRHAVAVSRASKSVVKPDSWQGYAQYNWTYREKSAAQTLQLECHMQDELPSEDLCDYGSAKGNSLSAQHQAIVLKVPFLDYCGSTNSDGVDSGKRAGRKRRASELGSEAAAAAPSARIENVGKRMMRSLVDSVTKELTQRQVVKEYFEAHPDEAIMADCFFFAASSRIRHERHLTTTMIWAVGCRLNGVTPGGDIAYIQAGLVYGFRFRNEGLRFLLDAVPTPSWAPSTADTECQL